MEDRPALRLVAYAELIRLQFELRPMEFSGYSDVAENDAVRYIPPADNVAVVPIDADWPEGDRRATYRGWRTVDNSAEY